MRIDPTTIRDLRALNRVRSAAGPGAAQAPTLAAAGTRLAVYGTLAPGQPNHRLLAGCRGSWTPGVVRGRFHSSGWGATLGFPAMVWDPDGEPIAVQLLESPDLERHWPALDEFEGDEYLRVLVPVETERGVLVANAYALRREST